MSAHWHATVYDFIYAEAGACAQPLLALALLIKKSSLQVREIIAKMFSYKQNRCFTV